MLDDSEEIVTGGRFETVMVIQATDDEIPVRGSSSTSLIGPTGSRSPIQVSRTGVVTMITLNDLGDRRTGDRSPSDQRPADTDEPWGSGGTQDHVRQARQDSGGGYGLQPPPDSAKREWSTLSLG